MANVWHLFAGFMIFAAGLASLVFSWPAWIPILTVVAINLYLLALLIEVARRTDPTPKLFELPDRSWCLLLFALVMVAAVCAFGAIYIATGDIVRDREVLTGKLDACYFSLVTLMTLGYGDFVPNSTTGRLVVMWQLGTSMLLLLVAVPLLVSRLATFR